MHNKCMKEQMAVRGLKPLAAFHIYACWQEQKNKKVWLRMRAAKQQVENSFLLHNSQKAQTTILRLFAPLFFFDSFLQNSLSNDEGFCRKLSRFFGINCNYRKKNVKNHSIIEKDTSSKQWQPYIAKYPWSPVPATYPPKFEIGDHTNELWHEAERHIHTTAPYTKWIFPERTCENDEHQPELFEQNRTWY